MTNENWSGIRVLLTDIDDTVTTDGRLTAEAYSALEAAQSAGYIVIPVTGRCAGWCDHIARMWPVDAVVGENGAFYFRYDHTKKKMHQYFCQSKTERSENARKLKSISTNILKLVPGTAIASDQPYRITDLAIDFAEDVEFFIKSNISYRFAYSYKPLATVHFDIPNQMTQVGFKGKRLPNFDQFEVHTG